jgi:hypothetical protein
LSAFDAYAAAFVAPLREAWLGDSAPVVLRISGEAEGVSVTAILFEIRQSEPEIDGLPGGVGERSSSLTRDVEFQKATLAAAGARVRVGMVVDIDDASGEGGSEKLPWSIGRVVSDTDVSIRVECSRDELHERAHASLGGGSR